MKEITYNWRVIRHDKLYSMTELAKLFEVNYATMFNRCNKASVDHPKGKIRWYDVINKLIPKWHPAI